MNAPIVSFNHVGKSFDVELKISNVKCQSGGSGKWWWFALGNAEVK